MQFDITPYRFLEWRVGFCCWDYVRLVLRDYLGAQLGAELMENDGPLAAARALRVSEYRNYFEPLNGPEEFAAVELQQFRSPDHVGLYVTIDGKPYITHCERGSGVLLSTLREISDRYQIIGYYRFIGSEHAG